MPPRPAHLPDPLVGLAPAGLEPVEDLAGQPPGRVGRLEALIARLVESVDDLAVDVELTLVRCAVADANGLRAFVPGEPGQLELREPPLSRDAVHDLQILRRAGDRAEEPVAPVAGLLHVSSAYQSEEREGRVAQPAVAVVPVPDAADPLGQRRRRSGDDSSGRRVRERLQREQRAMDGVVPATLVRAACSPFLPEGERRSRAPPPARSARAPARWRGTSGGRTARGRPRSR